MSYVGYDCGVRINAEAAAAAGGSFVLRYLSRGGWTQVTGDEIAEYLAAGLHVGLVFETTTGRALAGYGAGKSDALYVMAQLVSLGLPADMEVFFAVDSDADPVSVDPYFQGIHDAYANGGVYGSYRVVQRIESEFGIAGWQTAAWSLGARDDQAVVFQSGEQTVIGGVTVDIDYAQSLGKWAYGGPDMTPEDLLDYDLPRQGVAFDGTAQTGNTNLRAVLEWSDQGWIQSATLLAPMIKSLAAQLVEVQQTQAAILAKLTTDVPGVMVALSAQDKADMVQMFLRAQGAALAAVQVQVAVPTPAADTPA